MYNIVLLILYNIVWTIFKKFPYVLVGNSDEVWNNVFEKL